MHPAVELDHVVTRGAARHLVDIAAKKLHRLIRKLDKGETIMDGYTVGELIEVLSSYNKDAHVVISAGQGEHGIALSNAFEAAFLHAGDWVPGRIQPLAKYKTENDDPADFYEPDGVSVFEAVVLG